MIEQWPRWCKKKLLVELEQAAEVHRLAAGAADHPDVSAKSKRDLGFAEGGALQQQRPGIRRERQGRCK